MRAVRKLFVVILLWTAASAPSFAADREKIQAFMEVTGFDVALEGLRVSAADAPAMLGLDAADFGMSWTKLADEVFAQDQLEEDALDILEKTLKDEVLVHASDFYATPLGQRLVEAENASHLIDGPEKRDQGQALAEDLMKRGSPQPQYFLDMSDSIGSIETGMAQFREVQVRFILAAISAGMFDSELSEAELRAVLAQQDEEIRGDVLNNMIASNAYTYRDFSDEDIRQYSEALSTPEMMEVYELMNAVQFTLMADRYEIIAARLSELHPSQEL